MQLCDRRWSRSKIVTGRRLPAGDGMTTEFKLEPVWMKSGAAAIPRPANLGAQEFVNKTAVSRRDDNLYSKIMHLVE